MWPPAVEEIALVFRHAGIDARLEELAPGEEEFPGPTARASAYMCDGRFVVTLVPDGVDVDTRKLGCATVRPLGAPRFPFRGAHVVIDHVLLNERVVWLEAGSPRHAAAISPAQLARMLHAQTADLVLD